MPQDHPKRRISDSEEDVGEKPVSRELFYTILTGVKDHNVEMKKLFVDTLTEMKSQIGSIKNDNKEQLDRIELQTKKTNGRVNGLENWRSYVAGGLAVITIVGLPMLWILITDVKELRESKVISSNLTIK